MPDVIQKSNIRENAELREAFQEYEKSVGIPTARRASLIVAAFVLGGTVMDWQVYPDFLWPFLLIRTVCTLILVGVYLAIRAWPSTHRMKTYSYWIAMPPIIAICIMITATG